MRSALCCLCLGLLLTAAPPAAHASGYALLRLHADRRGNVITFQLLSVPTAGCMGTTIRLITGSP